jgi:hypothetical protein
MPRATPEPSPHLVGRLRVIRRGLVANAMKVVLAAEILIVYLRMRWLMRRGDVRSIVSAIRVRSASRPTRVDPGSPEARLVAVRLGSAVGRTLRILPTDSRCLVQSLVLSWLLSARAISSTLVIGARPKPQFAAHAWVEHEGQPVLPPRGFDELRLVEM